MKIIMDFELSLGFKKVDPLMDLLGYKTNKEFATQMLTITQTIPFIPNEEYIQKVKDALVKKCETNDICVLECKFKGYRSKFKRYRKFFEMDVEVPEEECSFDMELD